MLNSKASALRVLGAAAGLSLMAGTAFAGGLEKHTAGPDAKAWVVFSGYDMVKDANYSYQGVIVALNRDIGADGFVLRVYGSNTGYEYDTTNALGAPITVDGDAWQADAMIGYKISRGHWWAAAFVGVDWQSHDLTPDDLTARVRGTEVGVKVAVDFATLRNQGPVYAAASANYSTAFDSYWARGRLGGNLGHLTVGPEAIRLGNEAFDATRIGGFVMFDLPLSRTTSIEVTLSGGYQYLDGNGGATTVGSGGGEGAYFGINISSVF